MSANRQSGWTTRLFRPSYLRFALAVWVAVFTVFTLTRLYLSLHLETSSWTETPVRLLGPIAGGVVNDAGVALIFAGLAYWLVAVCARRGLRSVGHILTLFASIALVFIAVSEVIFWDEFASRLNGIAVFYLQFPREVTENLRESFDLQYILPGIGIGGLALWWVLRRRIGAALATLPHRRGLLKATAVAAVAVFAGQSLAGLLPERLTSNRELDQLALNGPANMIAAALTNDAEYDGVYPGIDVRKGVPLMRAIVAQDNTRFLDPPSTRSVRRFVDNGTTPRTPNIVVVIEESFASRYVDALDSTMPQPLTPNLTRLAKDGLFFTNMYASGQRTVRGLEAVLTSFTPIPGISTARRPGSRGMHSVPELLKRFGYQSAMLYAGRDQFDNMGNFWWGIGFDDVWDEGEIEDPSFTTAWGVSDEDLFTEALARMDARSDKSRPFFLSMLTVSNHRPYKFPQDHVQWNPALGNRGNTIRYADWAFGDFIERARTRPWFDDTVFVFVADHGHKVNGAADVPLFRYRIPMLIYSPKHVKPGRIDTLAAQVDLAPTLFGLLGMSYESNFFGMDLTRVPPDGGRIAIAHNFSVAFARPGHAVVLNPDGSQVGYQFTPGKEALIPEPVDAAVSADARALTQTAHHMFYAGEYHVPAVKEAGTGLASTQP